MGAIYLLCLIVLPVPGYTLWVGCRDRLVPWGRAIAQLAAGLLFVVAGIELGQFGEMADTEVHNGLVVGKEQQTVSCEHSYSCNCVESCSGSGSSRSCSTVCQTCYEHSHDYDWVLKTQVGDIEISRIDRQGADMPARYASAKVGDPVAKPVLYRNYIKSASHSLFNGSDNVTLLAQYAGKLPEYPATKYDYHYVDRVLFQGVGLPDRPFWEKAWADMLAKLGPSKQVNAVLVLTQEKDPMYAEALRAFWLGGKKNDVVVVMGIAEAPAIQWVRVFSWSDRELFKVELRDELQALPALEVAAVTQTVARNIVKSFVRKPMRDFEYLRAEVSLPAWELVLIALVGIAASIGGGMAWRRYGES